MISALIRCAIAASGCNAAERTLAQGVASEKELALLQKLLELFAGHAVEERRFAVVGKAGGLELRLDLRLDGAVEDRG